MLFPCRCLCTGQPSVAGLEQEVTSLESQLVRLNEYIMENQRLAALLAYKQVMEQI